MSILALAEKVDELITVSAEMKRAHLIAVYGNDPMLVTTDTLVKVDEHEDVYDLLASPFAQATAKLADAIAVVTCGWASPIDHDHDEDEQVAPSQHPQRRRVRLVVLATREHTASVLRFSDDWDSPITDEGQARGSLADAVRNLFE
jgi:hypothetical protein